MIDKNELTKIRESIRNEIINFIKQSDLDRKYEIKKLNERMDFLLSEIQSIKRLILDRLIEKAYKESIAIMENKAKLYDVHIQFKCNTCGLNWNSKEYPMGHVCTQLL